MRADVFVACTDGDLRTIENIYQENPRILHEVACQGNSVLHIAAREGHSEIVSWILTNMRDCRRMTQAGNSDRKTALHEAAKSGDEQVIRALLGYNRSAACRRNQFGETALVIASERGHVQAVELLLKATPWFLILWPRNDYQTCLHVAAYEGHTDVVKSILERPSYGDILHLISLIPDVHGGTPLHLAVHGRHLDIINKIMNTRLNSWWCKLWFNKSFMTKKDKLGRCPIHVAALNGCLEIIEIFISIMPDCIEILSKDLKTPVHFAVEYNQLDVVQKILSPLKSTKAAKMVSYDRDIFGNTSLHLAVMKGVEPQLVQYLLSFPGVKVNAINSEGQTALDIATSMESTNNPNLNKISLILEDDNATHSFLQYSKPFRQLEQSTNNGNDKEDKLMSVDTLVGSLVATVTFAAMFQVPDGSGNDKVASKDKYNEMALQTLFQVFLFFDCLGFFASITVVMAWIFRGRLQEKLTMDHSPLAKLSLVCLEISVMSTALAFLCATILATIPRHLTKDQADNLKEYRFIFGGEILMASLVPTTCIFILGLIWAYEYYFKATIESRQKHKTIFKQVVIYIIPTFVVIFTVIIIYVLDQLKVDEKEMY